MLIDDAVDGNLCRDDVVAPVHLKTRFPDSSSRYFLMKYMMYSSLQETLNLINNNQESETNFFLFLLFNGIL
jgi:hypothetical protein